MFVRTAPASHPRGRNRQKMHDDARQRLHMMLRRRASTFHLTYLLSQLIRNTPELPAAETCPQPFGDRGDLQSSRVTSYRLAF